MSLRFGVADSMPENKENFCFHCSRLSAENKNVPRIIEAAKKYGFELVLAGTLVGRDEEKWLDDQIGESIQNPPYSLNNAILSKSEK